MEFSFSRKEAARRRSSSVGLSLISKNLFNVALQKNSFKASSEFDGRVKGSMESSVVDVLLLIEEMFEVRIEVDSPFETGGEATAVSEEGGESEREEGVGMAIAVAVAVAV